MATFIILTIVLGVSQDSIFTGSVPAEAATFQVNTRNAEPFYAGIKVGGEWLNDSKGEIDESQEIELVPDEPWPAQETFRMLRKRVELKYEAPAMRRERLKDAWAKQGYTVQDTVNGKRPIRDEDVQYARKSKNLVAASKKAGENVPPLDLKPQPTERFAGWKQRVVLAAMMVGVVLGGGAALFLVVKKIILA